MITMACQTALAGRRAPVKAKGAAVRRRGGRAREDFVLETIYWDAGTARLLVTRQRHGTSGSPRPRDHLAGLREHHGAAGAVSSTGGGAGRWRRR